MIAKNPFSVRVVEYHEYEPGAGLLHPLPPKKPSHFLIHNLDQWCDRDHHDKESYSVFISHQQQKNISKRGGNILEGFVNFLVNWTSRSPLNLSKNENTDPTVPWPFYCQMGILEEKSRHTLHSWAEKSQKLSLFKFWLEHHVDDSGEFWERHHQEIVSKPLNTGIIDFPDRSLEGDAVIFPSYKFHRVESVTSGS